MICQGCVEREARIADLERRVAELESHNRQLEELLPQVMGHLPPPPVPVARPKADLWLAKEQRQAVAAGNDRGDFTERGLADTPEI